MRGQSPLVSRALRITALASLLVLILVLAVVGAKLLVSFPWVGGRFSSALPLPIAIMTASGATLHAHADRAWEQGDAAAARQDYELLWRRDRDEAAARKLFSLLLVTQEFTGADRLLQEMREGGSPPLVLASLQGLLQLHRGDTALAKVAFTAIADSAEGAYGLGLVALVEGRHEEARQFVESVRDTSTDPILTAYANEILAAYTEFGLFLDGDPTHLQTLLARALARVQMCSLALPILQRVTELQADYRDAWIILGYCGLQLHREEAVRALRQAYYVDPEMPEIQYFLARAYEDQGQFDRAFTYMSYAVVNGFEPVSEARARRARYAEATGRYEEALAEYRVLLAASGATLDLYQRAVRLLMLSIGDRLEAAEVAEFAVQSFPQRAEALDLRGWVALEEGVLDRAETSLREALSRDPSLASAWYHWGLLHLRRADRPSALDAFRRAYDQGRTQDLEIATLAAEQYNRLIAEQE